MGKSIEDEAPLLPSETLECELDSAPYNKRGLSKRRTAEISSFVASLCLNAVLLLIVVTLLLQRRHMIEWKGAKPVYTPVQAFVEYKLVQFEGSSHPKSPWDGPPTPDVDAAWHSLYKNAIVGIPKEQAALFSNHTEAFTGDESHYVTELDVHHQLHCLNKLRETLWPVYYPESQQLRFANLADGSVIDHLDHCVNAIRANLMCNADLTPLVWRWYPQYNVSMPDFDITHTCVNWDRIQDWTVANAVKVKIDIHHHVVDDLKLPSDP